MKTVIITGAASGIGRAAAELFARKGDRVVLADIDALGADRAAHEIRVAGGQATSRRLDVASEEQWEDFADWVRAQYGPVHILVNNAGVLDLGGFVEMTPEQWQRVIDIDLMGVIYGSRVFAQHMIEDRTRGHIVNIASAGAFFPSPLDPAYGVAKASVLMASQVLRMELRGHGIGVTALCPGIVRTELVANGRRAGLSEADEAQWREDFSGLQGVGLAGPEKVARAIDKAVRRNRAVAPVNPEAWALYALFRFSPSLSRELLSRLSFERLESVMPAAKSVLARFATK